ncbi:MAG: tetratricopeptide repeat protein [Bdellovibrionota bacterium]
MKEMNHFLATYEPESRWHRENIEVPVREYAHNRSEVYARFLATRYHEEAQKSEAQDPKKSENFALTAMGFYKKYFDRFSHHAKAYNLRMLYAELLFQYKRYETSAVQFGLVVKQNPKGKHAKKALVGQIDSLNHVETENYKKIQSIAEKKKATQEALPLPDTTTALINANILYVKLFPSDPNASKIYFQHAQLYYNYNYFDNARGGFEKVIQFYPDSDSADRSRHLILDIYNIQKNWVGVEKTAEAYLQVPRFATPKNKTLLLDLIQGAIFQQGKDKEDAKDYIAAAKTFENLVARYPDSKYADKALFNASIDYINADQSDKAIAVSTTFLKQYPNSDLAPQLMIALAAYFDEKLDYSNTARYYELYVSKAPKAKAAPDALFYAAVFREQLNNTTNLWLTIKNMRNYTLILQIARLSFFHKRLYSRNKTNTSLRLKFLSALLKPMAANHQNQLKPIIISHKT